MENLNRSVKVPNKLYLGFDCFNFQTVPHINIAMEIKAKFDEMATVSHSDFSNKSIGSNIWYLRLLTTGCC